MTELLAVIVRNNAVPIAAVRTAMGWQAPVVDAEAPNVAVWGVWASMLTPLDRQALRDLVAAGTCIVETSALEERHDQFLTRFRDKRTTENVAR